LTWGPEGYDALVAALHERKVTSCILVNRTNIRYVTGFNGDFGYAAVGPRHPVLFTSPLYSEHARSIVRKPFAVEETGDETFRTMAEKGASFWGERIGFEADALTCAVYEKIRAAFATYELVPLTGLVESFRAVKSEREIRSIERAQRIAERVLGEVVGMAAEGVTERDLACEIDYRFRKHGGERSAFDTIVAFGPESSKPHAMPGGRKLKKGDIILFDMGTVVDGYASDMTRTFLFGKADAEYRSRYETVLRAREAALGEIRAGMSCPEADRLARSVIEGNGFGGKFVHSLGHGVGLDVHEAPTLSSRSKEILESGMVVTVEPGLYFPGWGGIRIEDMVAVTDGGCENLTEFDTSLVEL